MRLRTLAKLLIPHPLGLRDGIVFGGLVSFAILSYRNGDLAFGAFCTYFAIRAFLLDYGHTIAAFLQRWKRRLEEQKKRIEEQQRQKRR